MIETAAELELETLVPRSESDFRKESNVDVDDNLLPASGTGENVSHPRAMSSNSTRAHRVRNDGESVSEYKIAGPSVGFSSPMVIFALLVGAAAGYAACFVSSTSSTGPQGTAFLCLV